MSSQTPTAPDAVAHFIDVVSENLATDESYRVQSYALNPYLAKRPGHKHWPHIASTEEEVLQREETFYRLGYRQQIADALSSSISLQPSSSNKEGFCGAHFTIPASLCRPGESQEDFEDRLSDTISRHGVNSLAKTALCLGTSRPEYELGDLVVAKLASDMATTNDFRSDWIKRQVDTQSAPDKAVNFCTEAYNVQKQHIRESSIPQGDPVGNIIHSRMPLSVASIQSLTQDLKDRFKATYGAELEVEALEWNSEAARERLQKRLADSHISGHWEETMDFAAPDMIRIRDENDDEKLLDLDAVTIEIVNDGKSFEDWLPKNIPA
jgi:hypothetical protein